MESISADDLKTIMKIIGAPIQEERLQNVAEILNQNMEALQILAKLGLPKELEPTSYLMLLVGSSRQ
jgi:hypothetical protein